jgi:hypothetical protein
MVDLRTVCTLLALEFGNAIYAVCCEAKDQLIACHRALMESAYDERKHRALQGEAGSARCVHVCMQRPSVGYVLQQWVAALGNGDYFAMAE